MSFESMKNCSTERLYNPETNYEKTLCNCIKRLFKYVKKQEENVEWENFHDWAKTNNMKATSFASAFMWKIMNEKADMKAIDQIIVQFEIALNDWGIQLQDSTREEIKRRRRLVWEPNSRRQKHHHGQTKSHQVNNLLLEIGNVFEWSIDQNNFKTRLQEINESARSAYPQLSEATRKEIHTMSRKSIEELQGIVLCSVAFMSVALATGARPSELAKLQTKDFSWEGDRLLLCRTTNKQGNKRGEKKNIWCAIVPHKHMRQCPIIHLARHLFGKELTDDDCAFGYGFQKQNGQSETSFVTMILRRITAVLESLFIIQNSVGLGEGKKLHIFRSVCSRILSNSGHTSSDIEDHIGWSNSTMQNHYQDQKEAARHRKTSFTLASRTCKNDLPALPWKFWDDTDKENQNWFGRVVQLSIASGLPLQGHDVDKSLQQKIDSYKAKVERGEIRISETPLEEKQRKRIRELEKIIEESNKRIKALEQKEAIDTKDGNTSIQVDPKDDLLNLLEELKTQSKSDDFATTCHLQLPRLLDLIERTAAITGKQFGIVTANGSGKRLMQVLRIAGSIELDKHAFNIHKPKTSNSWLSWIDNVKDTHDVVRRITTKTFIMYKDSITK